MRINDLIDALCKIRDEHGSDIEVELEVYGYATFWDTFYVNSGDFKLNFESKTLYLEYDAERAL